ncbi:hypothetical protein N0V88_001013 [Collariella sp. IMI 366227]|nr:hypothetical protein N0V88_001013 [Collariella sp. IMI 366227]
MTSRSGVARGGVLVKPLPAIVPNVASAFAQTPAPGPTTVPAPAAAPAVRSEERDLPPVPPIFVRAPTASVAPQPSPPKPTLTLAIPKNPNPQPKAGKAGLTSPNPFSRTARRRASGRDSVVTEFAEDGEGDSAAPAGAQIWRPPPTDPQSATTYYQSDKAGNWVLRSKSSRRQQDSRQVSAASTDVLPEVPAVPRGFELPSPDHKTRAERAKDAYGGFSPDAVVSPLRLPRKQNLQKMGKLGSPIAFKDHRRQTTITSPPASRLSFAAETVSGGPSPASHRSPGMFFAVAREPRDLTGGRLKRQSARRMSRRVSEGSVTSIESALEDEEVKDEAQLDLSPVVESPQAPISPGKSPVTYPEIRKANGTQQVVKLPVHSPPPSNFNVRSPQGRTGPGPRPSISAHITHTPTNSLSVHPADTSRHRLNNITTNKNISSAFLLPFLQDG